MKKCKNCGHTMSATAIGYVCYPCREKSLGKTQANKKTKRALASLEKGAQSIQEFLARKWQNS